MYKSQVKRLILGLNSIRSFVKNICNASETQINAAKRNSIRKALVVSKLSHYEFEVIRNQQLSERDLETRIRKRGSDFEQMIHYHRLHKQFESNVVQTLISLGIEVKVVNRPNYSQDLIEWADLIVPTGGDGTFLFAASRIRDNNKLIIGFNSDPHRSEGHLCLPKKYSTDVKSAIDKLRDGNFKYLMRNRIRTTIIGQEGAIIKAKHLHEVKESDIECYQPDIMHRNGIILPYLALNEVFIGESLSARVSHLELWINGSEQHTNLKSSGICVSTGTGSTSWNLSINRLPVQSVAELLRLLDIDATEGKDSLATVLANIYNNNLIYPAEDNRMFYTIRDKISAGVWPQPKGIKSRGFVDKLKVKSKCIDACLVIDGGVSYDFNDGTIAILGVYPQDALQTVILNE